MLASTTEMWVRAWSVMPTGPWGPGAGGALQMVAGHRPDGSCPWILQGGQGAWWDQIPVWGIPAGLNGRESARGVGLAAGSGDGAVAGTHVRGGSRNSGMEGDLAGAWPGGSAVH